MAGQRNVEDVGGRPYMLRFSLEIGEWNSFYKDRGRIDCEQHRAATDAGMQRWGFCHESDEFPVSEARQRLGERRVAGEAVHRTVILPSGAPRRQSTNGRLCRRSCIVAKGSTYADGVLPSSEIRSLVTGIDRCTSKHDEFSVRLRFSVPPVKPLPPSLR